MKMDDFKKEKITAITTSIRLRPEYKAFIKKNKLSARLLVEYAIKELMKNEKRT